MKIVPISSRNLFLILSSVGVASKHNSLGCGLYQPARLMEAPDLLSVGAIAHARRDFDTLQVIGDLLMQDALRSARGIGAYFKGLAVKRLGTGDLALSDALLQQAFQDSPPSHKASTIFALAANARLRGDRDLELRLRVDGMRVAHQSADLSAAVLAARGIAVWKARDGSNAAALADLERVFPMARSIARTHPHVYYDYLNSLAVENASAGHLSEALNISNVVIASSLAGSYPEWIETRGEILDSLPSRSVITVRRRPDTSNVVRLQPAIQDSAPVQDRGVVLSFPMVKKNRPGGKPLTRQQKQIKVIELLVGVPLQAEDRVCTSILDAMTPTPADKRRHIMEVVLGNSISDEILDKVLRILENRPEPHEHTR